ncbi:DUF1217 domain-containing protein [Fulvimarina sp. MAC3]|uniref:DUF1217 domain-containing protein n=1 Tax=Fulvimarina sp. MAC3 TaxID=3148887 RepID=UPI0031FBE070
MLSTLETFRLYTRDTTRIMNRIEADPANKRQIEYYKANIGKVSSVKEFMGDYQLYSYAMTAFGLEEQIESRGLIRKILESDIADPKSLVNKIGDDRYRELYEAFNFKSNEAAAKVSAQSMAQTDRTKEAYSLHRVSAANAVKKQIDDYRASIDSISTIDQFLRNDSVFKTALTAAGLDPDIASKSFIRDLMTGNRTSEDDRYVALKSMFDFQADGTAGANGAQSAIETNETIRLFYEEKDLVSSVSSALNDIDYWKLRMPSVSTADELTQDRRLLEVALYSVGIDASIQSSSFVWKILTSDIEDPNSAWGKMKEGTEEEKALKIKYGQLNQLFQFEADGSLPAGAESALAPGKEDALFDGYLEGNVDRAVSTDRAATSVYTAIMANVQTVTQFVRTPSVYEYALKAFGIDPTRVSRSEIVDVLRSDPGNPNSFAVRSGDERYVALAAAFNFDESGKIAQKRTAQEDKPFADTIARFTESYGEKPSEADKKDADAKTDAYRRALADVVTVSDFVNNKTIVDYITAAFDLSDLKLDPQELADILTSDFDDPESVVNKMDDRRVAELRGAFNFNTFGGINRPSAAIQSLSDRMKVDDLFLRQKFEEDAGAESEGARLALYFKRSAADIKNAYDILADPALLKVVQTAVGLPSESGQADIEVQKRTLEKRIDLESLQDPEDLSRFITRFVTLYDLENGGGSGGFNPAAILLGGGGGGGLAGFF